MMTSKARHCCVFCAVLLLVSRPLRAETPAGTLITNVTTLDYCLADTPQPTLVSVAPFILVDKVIRPALVCQNQPALLVNSPSSNEVLTFVLSNHGNSTEAFRLSRTNGNSFLRPLDFVPQNSVLYDAYHLATGAIFLESNHIAGFQANEDAAYLPNHNEPILAAGASQTIYVLSDTPAVKTGGRGEVLLTATAMPIATAHHLPSPPEKPLPWWDTPPIQATAIGTYHVAHLALTTTRNVPHQHDAAQQLSGATLDYRVAISLRGKGTTNNVMIVEPLPSHLSYIPNSIQLNGNAQTDAQDADRAHFIPATTKQPNSVAVSLGNITAPFSMVITFRATIN